MNKYKKKTGLLDLLIFNKKIQRVGFEWLIKYASHSHKESYQSNFNKCVSYFVQVGLKILARFWILPLKYRFFIRALHQLLIRDEDESIAYFKKAAGSGLASLDVVLNGIAKIQFYQRNYNFSKRLLELAVYLMPNQSTAQYSLGLTHLIYGETEDALKFIQSAVNLDRRYRMAHQNLAARYDRDNWHPTEFDLIDDSDIRLYDAYHFLGQLLVNSANVDKALEMFGFAMAAQERLKRKYSLPYKITERLHSYTNFDPLKTVRIIPYEWVTQIGHEGMLDALLKMQRLGFRPDCNWVLLAPFKKVANRDFLKCFQNYFVIVEDSQLIDDLFPYQRICGEQFNCYVDSDERVFDWSDIAAKAFVEWDRRGYGPLIEISNEIKESGERQLIALGLPKEAWFVALHVRSSGFYREGLGFTQRHRNASLSDYYPAIKRIHEAGGWVVRMGDPSMPKLKEMPRTIDIAHSPYRSQALDVYLWSQAKFFLGTTSGPTNAVISFHTPALLINCVSNYAQSWNNRVVFVLKPFWSKVSKRYLSMQEIFNPKFREKIFNINALVQEGIYPESNTSEEILAATEGMLEYMENDSLPKMQDFQFLENMGVTPWLWGNSHPSKRYFLNNNKFKN